MKKTVITASILSVLVLHGAAIAAPMSSELKVQGKMAAPSCQVSLDKGGVFDLGKLSNGLIDPNKATPLTGSMITITTDCDAKTYLSFSVEDNREGSSSSSGSTNFGLGNVNGNGKLGYYQLKMRDGMVDGKLSSLYSTSKGSTSFSAVSSITLDKNKVMGWAESTNAQNSGKRFFAAIELNPVLASSKDMNGPITDSVKLDGSALLNFTYGL
ncbi:DUF1120 domain-containing protein [Serratia marcescens]|uniref:DUF1120 domain-containing protein n=1 Tax=Serratia marcescens TaxID=615 RepID=UPI0009F48DB8|nr:DUF1120 domain-containing protein [Serratia marcescens]OQV35957.1 hypothetical protein BV901_10280 [Serratia nematodiphila]WGL77983.1 DUF1120 domain-containing protein [Serratia marcescens]